MSGVAPKVAGRMFADDERFRRAQLAIGRQIEDETVVIDLAQGRYYGLNRTGGRVWTLLESGATFAELRGALVAEFDVDEAMATKDLDELLGALVAAGLVARIE